MPRNDFFVMIETFADKNLEGLKYHFFQKFFDLV